MPPALVQEKLYTIDDIYKLALPKIGIPYKAKSPGMMSGLLIKRHFCFNLRSSSDRS